jgi:nitrogen regulatory protein P-II 1
MKKIEAIIRKTKFEDVKDALLEADIEWFSYYDVRGIGKSRQARIYRGVMYDTSSIERILISIVVRDKNAEKTVQAIIKSAQTGEIGDGRIFVIPIEDAIRIRTAERNLCRRWMRSAGGLPLPNPGHATRNRLRGRRLPTLPLYPEPLL